MLNDQAAETAMHTIRTGAIGAAISTLSLAAMAFLVLPAGLAYPGLEALTGSLMLSGADKTAFLGSMRVLFVIDGIFLLGWILAWTGLAVLVGLRDHIRGILVLVFGLAGALFDLGENGIILGALQGFESGSAATGAWTIAWKAIQHLSYWLPFSGALLASGGMWSFGWPGRLTAITGSIMLPAAVAGLYLPGLSLLSNAWFLLWFICLAALLWMACRGDTGAAGQKG